MTSKCILNEGNGKRAKFCGWETTTWALMVAVALGSLLTGCGGGSTPVPPPPVYTGPVAFTGFIKAGQLPVIGASVQIYVAGTAGNGSTPVTLLSSPLTTDSTGAFSVPATYTCPAGTSILYIVASGGHAGPSGVTNAGTVLASVPGSCASVVAASSFIVDEVTTIATAYALRQFLATGAAIGSTASNAGGLTLAAATLANLVNPVTGVAPGAATSATATSPTSKINTLANLLNACIVSGGAGSSTCKQLYTLSTPTQGTAPSNTFDAMIDLAKNPGLNVGALYSLSSAIAAYAPTLTAQPADWNLYFTYTGGGMNDPSALSIDSTGTVWVANYFSITSAFSNTGTPLKAAGYTDSSLYNSYGGAVNANDNFLVANEQSGGSLSGGLGSITVFNKGGSQGAFGGGGLNFPISVAFDSCGTGWVVDYGDSAVSLFTSSNSPVSASGYSSSTLVFPVAVATDAACNAYVANQSSNTITRVAPNGSSFVPYTVGSGPSGIAIDAGGNIWSANYYGNSVGLLTATGSIPGGSTGFIGGGIDRPQGIAADGAGNIWVANFRAPGLSEFAGTSATTPGAALSPNTGWAPDAGLLEAFALAIDASGNIWVSNFGSNTLTEFVGMAAPVKTPLIGPVRVP